MYGEGEKGAYRAKDMESCHGQHGPSSFRYRMLLFLLRRVRDKRHRQERTLGREDGSHLTDSRECTASHRPRGCFTTTTSDGSNQFGGGSWVSKWHPTLDTVSFNAFSCEDKMG